MLTPFLAHGLDVGALLVSALLFGGMTLFSFAFAAFLFTALPVADARTLIRRAFPHFYLFVIGTAAIGAALVWARDPLSCALLALVALSTVPTRQWLMHAINAATDMGQRRRFVQLHGLSVVITLLHIALTGVVLARFIR